MSDAFKSEPIPADLEEIDCYLCGSRSSSHFTYAWDDLTGKPGRFRFVTCDHCGLAYQNPRITIDRIPEYYDDEYIAHRKKKNWGILTPLYNNAMQSHDRRKVRLVDRYKRLSPESSVLDIGCGAGTFLEMIGKQSGAKVTGVDFKDLSSLPAFESVEFRCGLLCDQDLPHESFDLLTMWHFLEHDYDPMRTLENARNLLTSDGRILIEVPRLDSVTFSMYAERWPGLQAPQHTVLFSKRSLLAAVDSAGLDVVDYLPYGAFPAYFYLFTGLAFKLLKGKGLNLSKAIYPYFTGQLLVFPVLLFERYLNLAMQTVVCRRQT